MVFSVFFTERSVRPTCLHNFPVGFVPRPIFVPDIFILRNEKYVSLNRICHGVGAEGECISILIHTYKPVSYTYTNMPKGHKVLGLILVGKEMKLIRRGTEPVKVFTFRHKDIPNKVMYAANRYMHVAVEVNPESFYPV